MGPVVQCFRVNLSLAQMIIINSSIGAVAYLSELRSNQSCTESKYCSLLWNQMLNDAFGHGSELRWESST